MNNLNLIIRSFILNDKIIFLKNIIVLGILFSFPVFAGDPNNQEEAQKSLPMIERSDEMETDFVPVLPPVVPLESDLVFDHASNPLNESEDEKVAPARQEDLQSRFENFLSRLRQNASNVQEMSNTLFDHSERILSPLKPSAYTPQLKQKETEKLLDLGLKLLMHDSPDSFSPVYDPTISDTDLAPILLRNFLKPLWEAYGQELTTTIKNTIEQEEDSEKSAAFIDVIDGVKSFVDYLFSDEVNNPFSQFDPRNQLVLPECQELQALLKSNHPDPARVKALREKIRDGQSEALESGIQWIFEKLQIIDPFSREVTPEEYQRHIKEAGFRRKKNDLLDFFTKLNPDNLEYNFLRDFSEKIYKNQLGRAFYELVCESFGPNCQNPAYATARKIWSVWLLDSLNKAPREARSRMPTQSLDGKNAPNFGYRQGNSQSYNEWVANNPLALNTTNVIMDAFDAVINFGLTLDGNINTFIDLFEKQFSIFDGDWNNKTNDEIEAINAFYINPRRHFCYPLGLYLLNQIYDTRCHKGKSYYNQLLEKSGNVSALIEKAREELEKFINCCQEIQEMQNDTSDKKRGVVFGIGFNGEMFGAPSRKLSNRNEIYLTFSSSFRDKSTLFLYFLRDIAEGGVDYEGNPLMDFSTEFVEDYKSLIQKNFELHINYQKELRRYAHASHQEEMDNDIKILELDRQSISHQYESFPPALQRWVGNTQNWYRIPRDGCTFSIRSILPKIKIPTELTPLEKDLQEYSRGLILDTVSKRLLKDRPAALEPFATAHWGVPTSDVNKIYDLQQDIQDYWSNLSSSKRANLPSIQNKNKQIIDKKNNISKLLKDILLKQGILSRGCVNDCGAITRELIVMKEKLTVLERDVRDLEQDLRFLKEGDLTDISTDFYGEFKGHFFMGTSVDGCVEPLFSRVLGHDRFLSVYVSSQTLPEKKLVGNIKKRSIIDPCDRNCQNHVLCHLAVGDMLSYQDADVLNRQRETHDLGKVEDSFAFLFADSAQDLTDRRSAIPDLASIPETDLKIHKKLEGKSIIADRIVLEECNLDNEDIYSTNDKEKYENILDKIDEVFHSNREVALNLAKDLINNLPDYDSGNDAEDSDSEIKEISRRLKAVDPMVFNSTILSLNTAWAGRKKRSD